MLQCNGGKPKRSTRRPQRTQRCAEDLRVMRDAERGVRRVGTAHAGRRQYKRSTRRAQRTQRRAEDVDRRVKPRAIWRGDRWRLEEGPRLRGSDAGSDRRGGDPLVRRDSGRIPGRIRGPCSAEFAAPLAGIDGTARWSVEEGPRLRGSDRGSGPGPRGEGNDGLAVTWWSWAPGVKEAVWPAGERLWGRRRRRGRMHQGWYGAAGTAHAENRFTQLRKRHGDSYPETSQGRRAGKAPQQTSQL
jgi:hypothetical protein